MTAKDRPRIDPFAIQEAELIIATAHRMHGEWYGNYQEFLFFTALRHSEVFALEVDDCDLVNRKISVTKAVVNGQPKNRTKTNQDREVSLCPRALQVLDTQLSLRAQMAAAGMIGHRRVFFTAVGEPFVNTSLPYRRWTEVLETLLLRYRKPYNSRHSFISWRLMVGHNRLLVAQEAGHSVSTMERAYAAWITGAKPEDIERIKAAMAAREPTGGVGGNADVDENQVPSTAVQLPLDFINRVGAAPLQSKPPQRIGTMVQNCQGGGPPQ